MIYDLEAPLFIGRVLLVIAAVTSTIFPILYARAPWYEHRIGRAMMILSVTTALALWRSVILTFFIQGEARTFFLWLNVILIFTIIVATVKLSIVQGGFIRKALAERKQHE